MTSPVKVNFKVYQGSTFKEILRWESSTKVYKPITGISQSAPCIITCPNHGILPGWRFRITNVKGMKEINSSDVYHIATEDTSDTIIINALNTVDYSAYTSSGIVEYNEPIDISSYTARMQIREKIDSTDYIYELTTENNSIILDSASGTITIIIDSDITTDFTFNSAVYSMELVNNYEVIPFINGTLTLVKEVTR